MEIAVNKKPYWFLAWPIRKANDKMNIVLPVNNANNKIWLVMNEWIASAPKSRSLKTITKETEERFASDL